MIKPYDGKNHRDAETNTAAASLAITAIVMLSIALYFTLRYPHEKTIKEVQKVVYERYVNGVPPWPQAEEINQGRPFRTEINAFYKIIANDGTYTESSERPRSTTFCAYDWYPYADERQE